MSIHFNIVISEGSYYFEELVGEPSQEFDRTLLEKIRAVLKGRLSYSQDHQDTCHFGQFRKEDLFDLFDQWSRKAMQRFYTRESKILSSVEETRAEIATRIEIEKNAMAPAEERNIFPLLSSWTTEEILSYLTISELAVVARVNQQAQILQRQIINRRALSFKCFREENPQKVYLCFKNAVETLRLICHKSWFPKAVITYKQNSASMDVEKTLQNFRSLSSRETLSLLPQIMRDKDIAGLQFLLNVGLDPNARIEEIPPIVDDFYLLTQFYVELFKESPLMTTPLTLATREGFSEGVRLLLENKADPNVPFYAPFGCYSYPLHIAAAKGNLIIAQLLLQYHANIKARDSGGTVPFTSALWFLMDLHYPKVPLEKLLREPLIQIFAQENSSNTICEK